MSTAILAGCAIAGVMNLSSALNREVHARRIHKALRQTSADMRLMMLERKMRGATKDFAIRREGSGLAVVDPAGHVIWRSQETEEVA